MSEKFEIFNGPHFDNSVEKVEERTYYPTGRSYNYNDEIGIEINDMDHFICMSDSYLCIAGKLVPGAAGEGQCKLSNNAAMFLFDSISYEFNGKEIEKVRSPGITTTIRGLIANTKSECTALTLAGFNPLVSTNTIVTTDNAGSKFWFRIPLSFIFGLFRNYPRIMLGRHKIRLIRSRTDNNSYITTAATAGGLRDKEATITIEEISLKVQHLYPSREKRIELLRVLQKEQYLNIGFHNWELHELPNLPPGNTKQVWRIKTSMQLEKPRYVILAFQKDRKDNFNMDKTKFDSIDLRSFRVFLGTTCYPYNPFTLNFTTNQYLPAYQSYIDLSKFLCNITDPIIDYHTFESRALFIIDCSKQEEPVKPSTIDVQIEFESNAGFPNDTTAYCLIVHDKIFDYQPSTDQVRELV